MSEGRNPGITLTSDTVIDLIFRLPTDPLGMDQREELSAFVRTFVRPTR
jgi:hypothetical protein